MSTRQKRIGVLGGSFNPIHNGHLRLAIEALEILGLDRVELIPSAVPPHKEPGGLLPFGLRCRWVREAINGHPGLHCNVMEGRRKGPSYTLDTLEELVRSLSGGRLFFLLGVPDLLTLPTWKGGLELFHKADVVAVARQDMALESTRNFIQEHWLHAAKPERRESPYGVVWQWNLEQNSARMLLIHPPFLDISSTMIRNYWRMGRNMKYLVPDPVLEEMKRQDSLLGRFWK
ncbi:nicotinate-nucleotide adenylyltransferase [Desulfonatronum thiosulfatophilum]|uniref:Probable nicotinate-nucleotide adenylyltransferase n=1 Tax=Desulfonatronum thiosulfatophilum TaxID=617002 RepID=A0A1G6A4Q4_9BACT|nr:nicotinate (nicotinamide) nucleotide adenylyltransferase [Desulfonatronum thiosulfatophilum]SDB03246.1 nicotinate-nucleotide adenylyltransferase [Desulfonatronum thiosulfatophilum]